MSGSTEGLTADELTAAISQLRCDPQAGYEELCHSAANKLEHLLVRLRELRARHAEMPPVNDNLKLGSEELEQYAATAEKLRLEAETLVLPEGEHHRLWCLLIGYRKLLLYSGLYPAAAIGTPADGQLSARLLSSLRAAFMRGQSSMRQATTSDEDH